MLQYFICFENIPDNFSYPDYIIIFCPIYKFIGKYCVYCQIFIIISADHQTNRPSSYMCINIDHIPFISYIYTSYMIMECISYILNICIFHILPWKWISWKIIDNEFSVIYYMVIKLMLKQKGHWVHWNGNSNHFVYAPSQWETTLHCNVVSHWLDAYTKWQHPEVPMMNISLKWQHFSFNVDISCSSLTSTQVINLASFPSQWRCLTSLSRHKLLKTITKNLNSSITSHHFLLFHEIFLIILTVFFYMNTQ